MKIKKFFENNDHHDVEDFLEYMKDFGFTYTLEKSRMYVFEPTQSNLNAGRKLVDSYSLNMRLSTGSIDKIEILEMIEEFDDRMLSFGFAIAVRNLRFNETSKIVGGDDAVIVEINSSYYRLPRKVRKGI